VCYKHGHVRRRSSNQNNRLDNRHNSDLDTNKNNYSHHVYSFYEYLYHCPPNILSNFLHHGPSDFHIKFLFHECHPFDLYPELLYGPDGASNLYPWFRDDSCQHLCAIKLYYSDNHFCFMADRCVGDFVPDLFNSVTKSSLVRIFQHC